MVMVENSRVEKITALHGEIIGAVTTALSNAIEIGGLLTEQKQATRHGKWGEWVAANLPFDIRTAQNYMRAWKRRDELKNENVSYLSEAYELIERADRQARKREREKQREITSHQYQRRPESAEEYQRNWRVFRAQQNKETRFLVARGPDLDHRYLETAEFIVPDEHLADLGKELSTATLVDRIKALAQSDRLSCVEAGSWCDYRLHISASNFIYEWEIPFSGWFKSGIDHGLLTDWFDESLIYATPEELEEFKASAEVAELERLIRERDKLTAKIERIRETAEADGGDIP